MRGRGPGPRAKAIPGRPEPPPAVALSRYRLGARLGAGSGGVVVRAHDVQLDREVAVKLLDPREHHGDEARRRLLREARAIARVSHPNVLSIFDVGEFETEDAKTAVFLVAELVEGKTMAQWMAQDHPGLPEILDIFAQAAAGLAAAHERGLIHRDFKPSNVLVGDDGRVRVMDFGLARPDGETLTHRDSSELLGPTEDQALDTSLTDTGAVLGTPLYMPPEQHEGRFLTARADQYAFCAALFEALTGHRPFSGRTVTALHRRKLDGPPPLPTHHPVALRWLVRRGLAARPDARHRDMKTVEQRLWSLQRRLASTSRRRSRWIGGSLIASASVLGLAASRREPVVSAGSSASACPEASSRVDALWNDSIRAAIADAHASHEARSHLQGAVARLQARMETWVQRWEALREDACAARGRSSDSESRLDARCLDGLATEFGIFVDELKRGDPKILFFGDALLDDLGPPEQCIRAPSGLEIDTVSGASTNRARPTNAEVEDLLATARGHQRVGRYPEALRAARAAVGAASAARAEPWVLDARARVGWLEYLVGRPGTAANELERVFFAARSARLDELATESAARLSLILAEVETPAAALPWLRHAQAGLARLGDPSEELQATVARAREALGGRARPSGTANRTPGRSTESPD